MAINLLRLRCFIVITNSGGRGGSVMRHILAAIILTIGLSAVDNAKAFEKSVSSSSFGVNGEHGINAVFGCEKLKKSLFCSDLPEIKGIRERLRVNLEKALQRVPDKNALIIETGVFARRLTVECSNNECIKKYINKYSSYLDGLGGKDRLARDLDNLWFDRLAISRGEGNKVCKLLPAYVGAGPLQMANWYTKDGVQYVFVDFDNDGKFSRYFGGSYYYKNATPLQFYGFLLSENKFNYGLIKSSDSLGSVIKRLSDRPDILGIDSALQRLEFESHQTFSYFFPAFIEGKYYLMIAGDFLAFDKEKSLVEHWRAYLLEEKNGQWNTACELMLSKDSEK